MTSSKNGVSRKILDTAVNIYAITFLITLKLLAEFPATFAQVLKLAVAFISHIG